MKTNICIVFKITTIMTKDMRVEIFTLGRYVVIIKLLN